MLILLELYKIEKYDSSEHNEIYIRISHEDAIIMCRRLISMMVVNTMKYILGSVYT